MEMRSLLNPKRWKTMRRHSPIAIAQLEKVNLPEARNKLNHVEARNMRPCGAVETPDVLVFSFRDLTSNLHAAF